MLRLNNITLEIFRKRILTTSITVHAVALLLVVEPLTSIISARDVHVIPRNRVLGLRAHPEHGLVVALLHRALEDRLHPRRARLRRHGGFSLFLFLYWLCLKYLSSNLYLLITSSLKSLS